MAVNTPSLQEGIKEAPDFSLKGTDNKLYSLQSFTANKDFRGLVVAFICNHCPYVKAILDRIIRDAVDLRKHGIFFVAVMPNDYNTYPEDSFPNMQDVAQAKSFPFPYLLDDTQETARAYGAVCTPDFFGFDASLKLVYRGRLDASRKEAEPNAPRDLYEAMLAVSQNKPITRPQIAGIGCSVKWRD